MDRVTLPGGVQVTPLKIIPLDAGNVMHAMKHEEDSFLGFGEAYFSSIQRSIVKGWKRHHKMTLNLVVPFGEIRFIVHDGIQDKREVPIEPLIDVVLGDNNYRRLTVPPNFWIAFKGVGVNTNMLMNVANIEHDPNESLNKSFDFFNVKGCEDFE